MMRWRSLLVAIAVVLTALPGVALWQRLAWREAPGGLVLAGKSRSEVALLRAPAIAYPVADPTVGIPGGGAARPAARGTAPAGTRAVPTVAGRLASVTVVAGDRVETGQVVAQLDTALLVLGVEQARADLARARSDADAMDDTLDTLADKRRDLRDARRTLVDASAQLEEKRAGLVSGRAALAAQLAALERLAQAPQPPAGAPASLPPGAAPPDPASLARQLEAKLAELDAGLAKLDAGLAKLRSAERKLDSGSSTLAEARTRVTDARDVLRILAGGREIGVRAAEARLASATLRSPVSGVVVDARPAGTVVMVNAPVVAIRADGTTRVDTYVAPERLGGVRVGTRAEIDFDSNPGAPVGGRVVRIAERAEFPPTSFPTGIVHMTRVVRVTVAPEHDVPPGIPTDVILLTAGARTAAATRP